MRMKKIVLIGVLVGIISCLFPGLRVAKAALHPPHDASNVNCTDCHVSATNPIWTNPPQNLDDTSKNRICKQCHTGARNVETHSSLKTSNKYGDWTRECVACHYPHRHEQAFWRQYESTLTGTISAIDTLNNQFTLSINLPDRDGNGSADGDYVDWIMIPNKTYPTVLYRITANTANTVTVSGTIDTRRVSVGSTFGIIPGKFVKRYVLGPAGYSYVKFFSFEGTYGLVDRSGVTRYGICQVCHTQTQHWRYDGSEPSPDHNAGLNCLNCHDHTQGLAPTGGCDTCHGYPPVDSTTLISQDKNGSPVTSDSPGAGAHDFHANTRGYACSTCHTGGMLGGSSEGDDLINIGFVLAGNSLGGNYDGKPGRTVFPYQGTAPTTVTTGGTLQCSNLYCHSDVQANGGTSGATTYGTPVWTDPTSVQCGDCHAGDGSGNGSTISSGSHTAHLNAGKQCSDCHNGAGSGTQKHADYNIDVAISTTYGGSYSQASNPPGNGYGSCSSVYCHSDVQADGGNSGPTTYATPTWGGTVACGDCHAGDGSGNGSTISSGSHTAHLNAGKQCSDCHNGAGSGTQKHADYNIDVAISTTYGGSYSQATNSPGNGYGSCSNIYCHSDVQADGGNAGPTTYATPTWGGTVACDDCHGGAGHGNGQPATGSHEAHVATNGLTCNECHNNAGEGTTLHANKTIDISLLQGGTYSQGSHTPGSGGYGTCSSTYCHGTGTPQWGGTVACGDCHAVNNTLAGKHSTHWSVATNATATDRTTATNKSTAANYQFSCAVCHNSASHAGGPVGGGQTAEITFDGTVAGGGTYTAGSTTNTDPNGFDYTDGSCSSTYCHSDGAGGAPNVTPTWDSTVTLDCKSCHNYTATSGSPMASGKHTAHVGTTASPKYAFNCTKCHNATTDGTTITDKTKHVNHTKDVVFDALNPSGTYDSGTKACSSLYCHSDGNGGAPNVSVDWATATLPTDCTGCHGNDATSTTPMSSGGHTAHINKGTVMSNVTCDTCHTSTVSGDRTIADYTLHVNGTKDITINATYDGDTTPDNNYSAGQCSNIYCHSDATKLTGPYSAPNTVPTWGTTTNLGCSDCHTGPPTGPDYTNGSPKANSHAKHTGAPWNFGCVKCHSSTVDATNAIATPANHLNKTYDVSGTDIGSYTYNANGGTCSNIACHGGNNAQWGATLSCSDCHLGTGDTDDYTFNNGTTAVIDSTQWTTTGHGRTTGTYNVSGNTAANLSCEYCHDDTVAHGTTTNPFRLANYNVGGNGWNDVCFVCHQTGSSGYDPDGAGPLALKNSTLKIDKYHYGAKHDANHDGGSLCFDCHDPHGDSNIYMVHDNVTKDKADAYGTPSSTGALVFTANTTGTDYAKSSAPFNGVCNVCHTTTNHYTSTSGDGHNSGTRCTTCHTHSGDTTVDGNAFSPQGGSCDSCHGYPPAIGDGHAYMDGVGESKGAHTQHVNHLLSLTGYTLDPANDQFGDAKWQAICGVCHYGATHEMDLAGQNDNSSARHIQVDPQYSFDGTSPVYNGVPGTSSNVNFKSCSNVRCHFKDSPGWQDPTTAGQ